MNLWRLGLESSCDKLEPLYLYISTTTCLLTQNFEGSWLTLRESYRKRQVYEQIITLSCKISRLKTLHLYYCNAYDKQTWQEASTHKVIWPFDQVVLWSNVKIKYVIFALPQGSGPPSIAQGLRGCYKGFSPIKSHNPITTWPQGMRSFYQ